MRSRAAAAGVGLTLASAVLLSGLGVATQLAFDAGANLGTAVQPALTPILGFLVFADRLGAEQLLGGALVVAAVAAVESGGGALDWLPRRERRRLARLSGTLDVVAGSRLVSQGADPDAFFVIERGRASVERDERHVADLGAGDFFGELALLRRDRRTASVVAATDMRVRVIRRGEFIDAMRRLPTLASSVQEAALAR